MYVTEFYKKKIVTKIIEIKELLFLTRKLILKMYINVLLSKFL